MKTSLEKLRSVRIEFSLRERLVVIAALWWFLKNVSPGGFQAVFARRLLELMLKSVEPVIVIEADVTTFDFLGSAMTNYRELGSLADSEAEYVDDVIDKCNPVTEVFYEETLQLTVIEFSAR